MSQQLTTGKKINVWHYRLPANTSYNFLSDSKIRCIWIYRKLSLRTILPVQPSWETKCALHALLSNNNEGQHLVGGPHMLNTCLRRPQPVYTMVCLFEHVLAYSWHLSSGSHGWAQHVLAYHGITTTKRYASSCDSPAHWLSRLKCKVVRIPR